MEPCGLGGDATGAPGAPEQPLELGHGQLGGRGRVGGGGQDGASLGAGDSAACVGKGGEEAGVVLPQMGAELVVRGGARPDGVLLGAGEHGDGLDEFGVGG